MSDWFTAEAVHGDEWHAVPKGTKTAYCGAGVDFPLGAGEPTCKPCADAAHEADYQRAAAQVSGTRVCRSTELEDGGCTGSLFLLMLGGRSFDDYNLITCATHLAHWTAVTLDRREGSEVNTVRYYRQQDVRKAGESK